VEEILFSASSKGMKGPRELHGRDVGFDGCGPL
jgi:hypothetical protein